MLSTLHDKNGFNSEIYEREVALKKDTLYIISEYLDYCFDDVGNQVAPVSLLIESEKLEHLVQVIEEFRLFNLEVKERNGRLAQAHLLLHPKY